jgi:hypothetical protein
MEQHEESWFFQMVDRLQEQGYVRPGERVLKYALNGGANEIRRLESFTTRAIEVCEHALGGIPEDLTHDFGLDLPKATVLARGKNLWIATRGSELYGLALRELGRPRMQTVVQPT